MIRVVISEIVLTVEGTQRTAVVTIVWQGGATSTGTIQMKRPGAGHDHARPDDTAELIGQLAQHNTTTRLQSPTSSPSSAAPPAPGSVASQRFRLGVPACEYDPRNVGAYGQDVTVATITEAEMILGNL